MLILCTDDSLEQLETKLLKDISNIQYVLLLMIKHKTTKVPDVEVDQITDAGIFSLCQLNETSLAKLLFEKETAWTFIISRKAMLTTTPSSRLIYISLHYSRQSPKYALL